MYKRLLPNNDHNKLRNYLLRYPSLPRAETHAINMTKGTHTFFRCCCRSTDWCIALFLLLTAALLLNASLARVTPIEGDGAEYFLMSHSLLAHGDPAMRKSDMLAYDRALQQTKLGNRVQGLDLILRIIDEGNEWNGCYHRAKNGEMYSYHYWLYPLVNVPALAAARILGFASARSFLITNSLLILLAAFIVLFKAHLPIWARIAVLLMFLSCGTTFYLNWSGPEVFSACFVVIGCVFLLGKSPLLAALAFATAAQQNPPIGMLIGVALVFWMWRTLMAVRDGQISIRALVPQFLGVAAIIAFTLQSPLFYWAHFGVANLIVAKGASVAGLASHHRLISYYFDFDQGLIRGAPFLLAILFVAFIVTGFLSFMHRTRRRSLLIGLAFVVASILIAIPALSTANWVAGCRVYIRYAYWGSVPLWFAVIYFLRDTSVRQRIVILIPALLCQAIWIGGVYRFNGYEAKWLEHSWLTKQIIERYPEYYNPEITIFNVRTSANSVLPFAPYPGTLYYFEHPGRISKLLYHPQNRNNWIPECATTPAELEKRPGVRHISADDDWAYLNLGENCPIPNHGGPSAFWLVYRDRFKPLPPDGVSFRSGGNWDTYTWSFQIGWAEQTNWGVWIDGDTVNVSLLQEAPPQGPLSLTLTGIGAASLGQQPPETTIYVNGVRMGTAHFANGTPTSVTLEIPLDLSARSSGIFHVRLYMARTVAPQGPGRNPTGKPGIGMISMNLLRR